MTTTADRLRALAAAATPGPWRHGPLSWEVWSEDVRVAEVPHGARQPGVYVDPEINRIREPDAAFIAALSPERVLALADLIEAAADLRSGYVTDHTSPEWAALLTAFAHLEELLP